MTDYASENDEDVNYRRPKSPIKISSYVNYEEEEDGTSGGQRNRLAYCIEHVLVQYIFDETYFGKN
jgi:hypothetical protein